MTEEPSTDTDPQPVRRHFDSTIHKRRIDGTECFSSFLDEGETLIGPEGSRKAQHPEQ